MEYEIRKINIHEETEEYFAKYFRFSDLLFRELHPKDPLPPKEQIKRLMFITKKGEERVRYNVFSKESEEIIGQLLYLARNKQHEEYKQKKHIAEAYISVLDGYRDASLLNEFLKLIVQNAKEKSIVRLIETCCYRKYEWELWEDLDAKLALEAKQIRLYLDKVNWDLIENWRTLGQKIAKEEKIDLIFFQKCPDEIIKDFCKLYTDIINIVPFGEFENKPAEVTPQNRREREERNKQLGFDWYTFATREKNGEISGLTEIFHFKLRPFRIEQGLTGVQPVYRGRGLGKWLKAEMLFFIKNRFPDSKVIEIVNADMNAHMSSINQRMGFRTHLREKCYTIEVNKIKEKIS